MRTSAHINWILFPRLSIRLVTQNKSPFLREIPPTNVCQLFLDGCQRLLVEVRIVMKVFSQVSTIPGGAVKQKLVLCCSYKRTAAQYLAIYIQIAKPLLGSYITVGDTKKVAKPIPITPERVGKHKKQGISGYISFSVLLSW